MARRPHPKNTTLDLDRPDPWSTSDRTGFIGDHSKQVWQLQWSGSQLINTRLLVNPDEYDIPNEQFRTLVLPPDPDPLMNARPEPYVIDETDWLTTGVRGGGGSVLETQNGELLVTMPSATEAESEDTN